MPREREAELSIRLVWPFARLTTVHAETAELLARHGIGAAEFANSDTRIPHRVLMELLAHTLTTTGDPAIGLHAGEQIEPGDFDVLEYMARSAANLADAIGFMAKYFRLMHDALEVKLEPEGENVVLSFAVTDRVPQLPAANDFMLATAIAFSKRNTAWEPAVEIRVAHEAPSYTSEYARIFQTRIRFNAPCNAIVMRRDRIMAPMLRPSPRIAAAFEIHARQLLERLREGDGITGRVRETVAKRLGGGDVSMQSTARSLAMSVATLRRRLEAEGTSFADIVDEIRRRLAERHLREPTPAVSEIALLLGFSNVTAFHRAFRRWTGVAPTEFRARARNV